MDIAAEIIKLVRDWLPPAIVFVVGMGVVALFQYLVSRRPGAAVSNTRWIKQLITFGLTAIVVVMAILISPMGDSQRSQLLSLLGLLGSAVIALSATTFVGNALAGMMLRAVRNFGPGDFLRVGEHFGRVSEQGLLHTEIQTEDRNLTTLPNLFLATNPVTVVRSSGTIVAAQVSLGYDVPRDKIERALKEAAEKADLEEPFVQVLELGDHSVTYRVAGFLSEVKKLISARCRLRLCMLDCLHLANIEIVSPTFMNQRAINSDKKYVPKAGLKVAAAVEEDSQPEDIIFDKAEQAETREKIVDALKEVEQTIQTVKAAKKEVEAEHEKEKIEMELGLLERERKRLSVKIEIADKQIED